MSCARMMLAAMATSLLSGLGCGDCGGESPPPPAKVCEAGATANCVCGSEIGQKTCKDDGSAWGECSCAGQPDGSAGDAISVDTAGLDAGGGQDASHADAVATDTVGTDAASVDSNSQTDAGVGQDTASGVDAECPAGHFGLNCDACTCLDGVCNDGRYGNGTCTSCTSGYFGTNCENTCTCDKGTCDDGTDGLGHCTACVDRYFGQDCNTLCTCSSTGGTCNDGLTGDGLCSSCNSGYFGTLCDAACTCVNGTCSEGLTGDGHCSACDTGYFGTDCDAACTCVNGTCNEGPAGDGRCSACESGYFGVNCDNACNCVNGTCDEGPAGDGTCTCDTGWEGATCAAKKYTIACKGNYTDLNMVVRRPRCVRNPDSTLTCTDLAELPTTEIAFLGKWANCVIKTDGSIFCTTNNGNIPAPNAGWKQVTSTGSFNCGLKQNGSVQCWGFGTMCTQWDAVPAPNNDFTFIDANGCVACGIRASGEVVCWGAGFQGAAIDYHLPTQNEGIEIMNAGEPACYLKNGTIECTIISSWMAINKPSPLTNGDFVDLHGSFGRVCGIHADETIECWGTSSNTPITNERFYDIDLESADFNHQACAVRTDGTHECWTP